MAVASSSETASGTCSACPASTTTSSAYDPGASVHDAVADGEPLDPLAHLGDDPGPLAPDDVRVLHRVHAGALVRVDEVHARHRGADEELPRARRRVGQLGVLEDLGTARRAG